MAVSKQATVTLRDKMTKLPRGVLLLRMWFVFAIAINLKRTTTSGLRADVSGGEHSAVAAVPGEVREEDGGVLRDHGKRIWSN